MGSIKTWLKDTANSMLLWPSNFLHFVDQKVGIEVFKLGVVLATVYFVQGMGGLTTVPLLFYFKDVLHFNEAQVQYFSAISGVAWLVKPLFGFISDRWPIFGYRRKSYMILMAITASLAWLALAAMVHFHYDKYAGLVLVFNLSSLGYAFVDVVCDGLMVQRGQELNEKMEREGKNPDKLKNLVNLQWFAIGISGFIASISGGNLQHAVKAGSIPLSLVFVIAAVVPLLTAVIGWIFVNEEKITRRSKAVAQSSQGPENKESNVSVFKELLTSRTFWILTAFLFFWHYSPSFSAVANYYSIDVLKFDDKFLGLSTAVWDAIFPLAIILYFGLLKWFPKIRSKTYLYLSIVIGLVYSAISYLFYLPAEYIEWMNFSLPGGGSVLLLWVLPLALVSLVAFIMFRRAKDSFAAEPSAEKRVRAWFVCLWVIVAPLSLIVALWFSGAAFAPFKMSYRSLSIINAVIFGYLTIASFLIPLSLAGELAPKKAEAMTYAYFMALINVSKSFIPDLSGAKMFEILKEMLLSPSAIIVKTPWLSFGICVIAAIAAVVLAFGSYKICKKLGNKGKIALFVAVLFLVKVVAAYFGGMAVIGHLKTAATYLVQHSFLALKPIIGNADWLGENGYRALILRYSVIVGAVFTALAAIFVYILPEKKEEK